MTKEHLLLAWLNPIYGENNFKLSYLTADAGDRIYYRLLLNNQETRIVMSANPEAGILESFIKVAHIFRSLIRIPRLYEHSLSLGFLVLEDFGDNTLIHLLKSNSDLAFARELLLKASAPIIQLQKGTREGTLPLHSASELKKEMDLFIQWGLLFYYGKTFTPEQRDTWNEMRDLLVDFLSKERKVYVHRDYIIRNLILLQGDDIGILDFQDAVLSTPSYDIFSLTQDAFIYFEEDFVLDIVIHFWQAAKSASLPVPTHFDDFYQAYEWQGVQRLLRIIGVFARLKEKDHRDHYVNEIPFLMKTVVRICRRHRPLHPLYRLLNDTLNLETTHTLMSF